jgi:hypothetical protein
MPGHSSEQRCDQILTSDYPYFVVMDKDLEKYFGQIIGV